MLGTLVAWAFECLDLERARRQPVTAYKTRHPKMGNRMPGLLCSCDSYVAFHMLVRSEFKEFKEFIELQNVNFVGDSV